MTLSPVVTSSRLAKHEVIRSEELTERSGPNGIHGTRLQIHQDGTGDVLSTASFIVINIDTLQLQLRFAMIGTVGLDTVLIRDNFPKLIKKKK